MMSASCGVLGSTQRSCLPRRRHQSGGGRRLDPPHPRLMVLANLGTLIGVRPRELTDWFWAMFIDAYDWVVEPTSWPWAPMRQVH